MLSNISRTYGVLLLLYVCLTSLSRYWPFTSGCNNGGTCPASTFCCSDGTCASPLASCGEQSVDLTVVLVRAVMSLVYYFEQAAATVVSKFQVQLLHVLYIRYLRTVDAQSVTSVVNLSFHSLCLSGSPCGNFSCAITRSQLNLS